MSTSKGSHLSCFAGVRESLAREAVKTLFCGHIHPHKSTRRARLLRNLIEPHTMRRPSLADHHSLRSSAALAERSFPMYVLPIAEVLQLSYLPVHEDVFDKLVEWQPGMASVVFVSQTWLSYAHPDNADNVKLTLLKEVLQMAQSGELSISMDSSAALVYGGDLSISAEQLQRNLGEGGYVWFDIFSVPQRDAEAQGRAIASIMSFIADSAYFMVVAGAWKHMDNEQVRDFSGWMGRGWCRIEQVANALGPIPKPVISVQSTHSIVTHGPGGVVAHSWLQNVFGLGAFTVDADRKALGPVIDKLINSRMAFALENGELLWYRVLHCAKSHLLEGTGMVLSDPIDSLDKWLAELGYTSVNDGVADGLVTPLMCAAIARRVDFLRELLERGAEIDATVREAHSEVSLTAGMSALHISCSFGDEAGAQLLIEAGADLALRVKTPQGAMPICAVGYGYNFASIFNAYPELHKQRDSLGVAPVEQAAMGGQAKVLRYHLQQYPQTLAPLLRGETSTGRTLLADCLVAVWNEDAALACVEAGCDVNQVGKPDMPKIKVLYAVADAVGALSKCLGKAPSAVMHRFSYCSRCTPLHYAAYFGNLGGVEFLLANGADAASTTHPYKMTPAQLAELQGHALVVQKLSSHKLVC